MQEENDNILVCMNGDMDLAAVIKEAAGIAKQYNAALTAIYVETRGKAAGREAGAAKRLALAERYHARVVTVNGENAADQIVQYAKAGGITKIIAGYPENGGLRQWKDFVLTRELAKKGKGIELILVSASAERKKSGTRTMYKSDGLKKIRKALKWKEIIRTAVILLLFTIAGLGLSFLKVGETNIIIMYMISILVIAIRCTGRGYAIVSSLLVVLLFNFLFTEPKFTLKAYGAQYPITFLFMFTASIIISAITLKVKQQAKASAVNAYRTEVLLETSRQLQAAAGWDDIIEKSAGQLIKLLKTTVIVFPVQGAGQNAALGEEKVYTAGEFNCGAIYMDEDERKAAGWTMENLEPAGASTEHYSEAAGYYLPVRNGEGVACVIGVVLDEKNRIEPMEKSLLAGMMDEISLAIEKYSLDEKSKYVQMEAEKEHLRADLLRAISHDLRTPLTSISGNASILLGGHAPEGEAGRKLLKDIEEDSRWLIQLVENLLAITKIDNGGLIIRREPELIEEVILEAMKHVYNPNEDHEIVIGYQEELLMAEAEAALIIQVVVNIINNAVKYTPPGSKIQIKSFTRGESAVVEISDDGNGIADRDKEHVFEMFFTADKNSGDGRRGLGLGLALCKSIISAHDGEIYIRDNKPKGAVFGFTLKKVSAVAEQPYL